MAPVKRPSTTSSDRKRRWATRRAQIRRRELISAIVGTIAVGVLGWVRTQRMGDAQLRALLWFFVVPLLVWWLSIGFRWIRRQRDRH